MEKYGVKMFFFTFVTDVIVEDDVVKGIANCKCKLDICTVELS